MAVIGDYWPALVLGRPRRLAEVAGGEAGAGNDVGGTAGDR
jgi:hypothetical protein